MEESERRHGATIPYTLSTPAFNIREGLRRYGVRTKRHYIYENEDREQVDSIVIILKTSRRTIKI
ncbi:hypothetical protein QCA50_020334 [Cerrena zonata]|uniref:Uncharacterized protein n=1 Tax=Cerrena zonata TaxID=2478898 RepID=A0AAW0FAK1_9APHY